MPETVVVAVALVVVIVVAMGAVAVRRRRDGDAVLERPEDLAAEAPAETAEAQIAEAEAPPRLPAQPTLRDRLGKTRRLLADRLADALGRAPDDETWDDIEAALIQADVGVETATKITDDLRATARDRNAADAGAVRALLAEELVAMFAVDRDRSLAMAGERPTVWIVVGVNGTGKTTTIGKLAADVAAHGRSVAFAAADTFRAAADEQLQVWADRTGAVLVKHQPGADPAAVAFDAYRHARARGIDVLIVDTAGRLHTKTPLMAELAKIRRVIEREGEVAEVLLVIDATAGQNGLVQAREFAQATGVTGVVLTKLDGTAKGGIALAIEQTLRIPIKLIGVGEGLDDLEPFDPKTYVDALLA